MVLNGRGERYTEETRKRVIEAAEALEYRPDISARGLRMNRSFLIGLSVFESNAFLTASLMRGVQRGLRDSDYSALVFSHSSREEELELHRRCAERKVDGMIINPGLADDGSADTKMSYLDLIARNVPVVEIFGRAVVEAPAVNFDGFAAGRVSVEHLLALGHRRIALLTHDRYRAASATGFGRHADAWHRYEGYRHALAGVGLEPCVFTHPIHGEIDVEGDFLAGGSSALDQILEHPARPTAIICYNDLEAFGLIRAARERNVNVPRDLSVMGYGDLDFARLIDPPLTTLSEPAYEIGQRAAECLLALIDKKSFEDVLLDSTLVPRASTGAPS
jgi:DNA-binding LacI/PurR family transcriptional regulator